jgi:hypothetical protein
VVWCEQYSYDMEGRKGNISIVIVPHPRKGRTKEEETGTKQKTRRRLQESGRLRPAGGATGFDRLWFCFRFPFRKLGTHARTRFRRSRSLVL